ncbi:MAG: hypothetical protein LDLANPLL_02903 [Turneriella sp.]|nr:hypothetical protein [Turneriella sp.]
MKRRRFVKGLQNLSEHKKVVDQYFVFDNSVMPPLERTPITGSEKSRQLKLLTHEKMIPTAQSVRLKIRKDLSAKFFGNSRICPMDATWAVNSPL